MIRILYAEDDVAMALLNRDMLEKAGYEVDIACNGEEAWQKYRERDYQLLLLDIIMPGKSGFDLIGAIREKDTVMPIIIYSSLSGSEAVAKALDMGADDYIRKECEPPEILARLNVIIRRQGLTSVYELSPVTRFCYSAYLLTVEEKEMKLTPIEAKLLRYLCEKENAGVTKPFLCEKLWGIDNPGKERTIDNYMVRLRKYLKRDKSLKIETHYGEGYCLVTGLKAGGIKNGK